MEFHYLTFQESLRSGFSESAFELDVWPTFLNQDSIGNEYYAFIVKEFSNLHCLAVTKENEVAGTGKILPFYWDGTWEGLPKGWDEAVLKSAQDWKTKTVCNSASAWSIEIKKEFRGTGLSHSILSELKKNAMSLNISNLFACVRPNQKENFPFESMEEYLERKRPDGFSEDPWVRVHEKAGGKRIRIEERSMYVSGSVEQWETWTQMKFPESGSFAIPGALVPVGIDREKNLGEYVEPNVWFQHKI
ncbi:GNAT family N-acetyltransferase [Leptospira barantonii]|uniref:GNAT family N-acetyltransferase n=1 Tax=Leptospira barantonii TaxID=2023184 RepID=UPI0014386A01|nr:GNAT family N-acetyltransferase [Leptospira barantonii]